MGKRQDKKNKKSNGNGDQRPPTPDSPMGDLEMARQMTQMKNLMSSAVLDRISGNATTSQGRSALAQRLGFEYQGDRDVYTALGYIKDLRFEDYLARYRRGDISKRIITAPVKATWRNVPVVNEVKADDERAEAERTTFEQAWDKLAEDKTIKLFHNLQRVDKISGIGLWGALFLGFSDATDRIAFATEVQGGAKLLYLTALNEAQSSVSTTVNDPTDPRFGLPEFYEVQFVEVTVAQTAAEAVSAASKSTSQSVRVHWSRMIHVAEDAEDTGVVGTPRLQAVFNRLMDMDRVVGGTGESFWRNAFPGVQFKLDDDAQMTNEQDLDELRTQIDSFVHRWERYIRTKGISIEQLAVQVAPPKQSFEVILSIIAGTTEIPQRILVGSERGELASSQDQTQWGASIEERREQHVEPVILDEFILRMIAVGVLPEAGSWSYVWPEVFVPSEKDKAEVAAKRTEALVKYADSLEAGNVVPLSVFLRNDKFMDFSDEEAKKIEKSISDELAAQQSEVDDEATQIVEEETALALEGAIDG